MAVAVDKRPAIGVTRLVPQCIHQASILVVEQVQDRFVPLFGLDQIVHFFLLSVHRGSILVKISCQYDEIFFSVVERALKCFLLDETSKLFYLLVAADEGLHI